MIKKIVKIIFKFKKPKYVYRYTEECWGTHVDSEYMLKTRILFLNFIEEYSYGNYKYEIELRWLK